MAAAAVPTSGSGDGTEAGGAALDIGAAGWDAATGAGSRPSGAVPRPTSAPTQISAPVARSAAIGKTGALRRFERPSVRSPSAGARASSATPSGAVPKKGTSAAASSDCSGTLTSKPSPPDTGRAVTPLPRLPLSSSDGTSYRRVRFGPSDCILSSVPRSVWVRPAPEARTDPARGPSRTVLGDGVRPCSPAPGSSAPVARGGAVARPVLCRTPPVASPNPSGLRRRTYSKTVPEENRISASWDGAAWSETPSPGPCVPLHLRRLVPCHERSWAPRRPARVSMAYASFTSLNRASAAASPRLRSG